MAVTTRWIALTVALGIACPLQAAVVFEIETIDHDQNPPQAGITQVQAEGRLLKMNVKGSQGQAEDDMIFRGARREMVLVDHRRQSYMLMDAQTMQNFAGQINRTMGQMQNTVQDALKNVSPDQRAQIEQLMKQRGPQTSAQPQPLSKPVVRKVGNQATVYGYPCVLYEVLRDGRIIRNLWVTDWNNITGGREIAQNFTEFSDFIEQLANSIPQAGAGMRDNPFTTMRELGGFPVASREYRADGTVESESALRSAKTLRLKPAAFEPPRGYRAEQMFGGR